MNSILRRSILPAITLALAALTAPLAAAAQDMPSYARPVTVSTDETIHGRIASVDGSFNITVNDDRGFVDSVELHQGTIINPRGLSLSAGMSVTIAGYNGGSIFNANEIDTPYSYSGELPTPVYYGPGYWCPGFGYGYGPSFSLAIIIGGGDRFEHRPFYGRPWDGHGYFGGYVGRPYGGHDFIGERHGSDRRGFAGEHRAFTGAARPDSPHVPSAFAGRSFAGERYTLPAARSHAFTGSAEPARSFATRYSPGRENRQTGGFAGMSRSMPATRSMGAPATRSMGAPRGPGIRR